MSRTAVTGAYQSGDQITLRYGDDELQTYDLRPPFVVELARITSAEEWLLIQRAARTPGHWAELEPETACEG